VVIELIKKDIVN